MLRVPRHLNGGVYRLGVHYYWRVLGVALSVSHATASRKKKVENLASESLCMQAASASGANPGDPRATKKMNTKYERGAGYMLTCNTLGNMLVLQQLW